MKTLSAKNLEQIACRVWKAYQKLPQFQNERICWINPEILAKDVLGLDIQFHHLSCHGRVLGVTSPNPVLYKAYDDDYEEKYVPLDGKTILVEKNLKEDNEQKGRYHFTIAHEASHQILKMLYPKEYGADSKDPQFRYYLANPERIKPIRNWEEWQANTLGGFLLMPEDLIGQALFLFGLTDGIKTLNRIYYSDIYERFANMADFLGVSKKALSIRLKKLGLLEKDYLENPDGITDIWKSEEEKECQE